MKSILLTTTAIVAFAGAAAAGGHTSVGFGGDVTFGVNTDDVAGEDGFYFEGDLNVNGSATLDNGITAGLKLEFDLFDEDNGNVIESDGVLMSLTSANAGLYLGDTSFAAEKQWNSAGDMEADGFSEADGENVLRADFSVAGFDVSVSGVATHAAGKNAGDKGMVNAAYDPDASLAPTFGAAALDGATLGFQDNDEMIDQLSIGVAGAVGMISMSAAYQQESVSAGIAALAATAGLDASDVGYLVDAGLYAPAAANGDFTEEQVFGISGSVAVAGADVTLAYAAKTGVTSADDLSSIGIEVAYPFGPVTATVYYVAETNDADDAEDNYGLTVAYADGPIAATAKVRSEQDRTEWNLEGSYDTGFGLTVLAGMLNENEGDDNDYYVGGSYDLGGGASALFVYADDVDGDQSDEIGSAEYLPGTTVEVSFKF